MTRRVLYVSDSTTVSGAEMVMLAHVDHFAARGWSVHVFCHERNSRLQHELSNRACPFTPTAHYSRILLETTPNPRSLAHFAQSFRRIHRDLVTLMRTHGSDLVHAVSYPASLYAASPASRLRVPAIWHEHNIKRLHAFNRPLFRYAARPCAWAIGPSSAVTRTLELAGIPKAKVRVVYNGVDLSRFDADQRRAQAVRRELGLGERDRAVALPGQMIPIKGHRFLVDVAPAILEHVPAARFFFIGSLENPPYEEELRAAIRAAGLHDRFVFTGWRRDMPDVLRAMDAVVLATTRPEPAALSLMETMAAARPIVAVRNGGTEEIVVDGETGLLFEPGDVRTAAAHLVHCLRDRSYSERIGRAGRARVEERFTLARHLDEIETLYRTAIAGAHTGRSATARL
ncbi:MAG: glycosyltransferase family 4 protein [Vicinamibacterales bacterium]